MVKNVVLGPGWPVLKSQLCSLLSCAGYSNSLNLSPCLQSKASDTNLLGMWEELNEIMNRKGLAPRKGSIYCGCDFVLQK